MSQRGQGRHFTLVAEGARSHMLASALHCHRRWALPALGTVGGSLCQEP